MMMMKTKRKERRKTCNGLGDPTQILRDNHYVENIVTQSNTKFFNQQDFIEYLAKACQEAKRKRRC